MRSMGPPLRSIRIFKQHPTHFVIRLARGPSKFPAHPAVPARRLFSEQSPQSEFSNANKSQENPQRENKQQQQNEEQENPKNNYKEDTGPPPDPNKSPFQVFVDTFKSELSKSRELQESVKALQDESGKIGDSEALRRAKEAYAKARVPAKLQKWKLISRNNRIEHQI